MAEFSRAVLDSLRQPLETGKVTVARANAHLDYPADVQLIAAMNPCRCGHLGDAALACHKAPRCAQDYQSKISGPLMDRMDIHSEVAAVSARDLALPPAAEDSRLVAARVAEARARQQHRFERLEAGVTTNARADGRILEDIARPDEAGSALLEEAAERFRLTARGYHRVLRVARTLADLAGVERVTRSHIAEALTYRRVGMGR
jgi:magnesium chelatase family protein